MDVEGYILLDVLICWTVCLLGCEALDRPVYTGQSIITFIRAAVISIAFGFWLTIAANPVVASIGTIGIVIGLRFGSRVKQKLLGEPLVFTDVLFAFQSVRHWRLCFLYMPSSTRLLIVCGAIALCIAAVTQSGGISPRLVGLAIVSSMCCVIACLNRATSEFSKVLKIAVRPDPKADIAVLGLVGSLAIYAWMWRRTLPVFKPLIPIPLPRCHPMTVVVIACEILRRSGRPRPPFAPH